MFTLRVRQTARRANGTDSILAPRGLATPRGGATPLHTGPLERTASASSLAGLPAGGSGLGGGGGGGLPVADWIEETLEAKLHLVDLAGSERVGKSRVAGTRLLEACSINQVRVAQHTHSMLVTVYAAVCGASHA